MSRTVRRYGKARTKPIMSVQLFAELPKSPVKTMQREDDSVHELTEQLVSICLDDNQQSQKDERQQQSPSPKKPVIEVKTMIPTPEATPPPEPKPEDTSCITDHSTATDSDLPILTWDDVCPAGDQILKIAEASYAEVYRITNPRGTSIIKVIRLESPIKPQTKAQQNSGLVDEEPHQEDDLAGELRISEWLADIPGFVVYRGRRIVEGKTSKALLQTHQAFQRKVKRKDPDRLQFYPSPSRYLDDTRFLVIELGDAGTALEDFPLDNAAQLWDIFFHTAVALARAEDLAEFEHRDLHEGNLCIRQASPPTGKTDDDDTLCQFGYSGLDITILDYGLSRASDKDEDEAEAVAYDLEKDLSLFTSTHAPQCKVYRQMRSFLLSGDRVCLPPKAHNKPYAMDAEGRRIDWKGYYPYTNVLWLAYVYQYLVDHFKGSKKELSWFKRETKEMWRHLNPEAPKTVQSFSTAGGVVEYALACEWIREEQLAGGEGDGETTVISNDSIIEASAVQDVPRLRRSPRRRKTGAGD